MHIIEIGNKIPVIRDFINKIELEHQEICLAQDLFQRWDSREICYDELISIIRSHVAEYDFDENRVFHHISVLCNPSREM